MFAVEVILMKAAPEQHLSCFGGLPSPVAGARPASSRRGTSTVCASMKLSSRDTVRPSPSPPPVAAAAERTTGPSCLYAHKLRAVSF